MLTWFKERAEIIRATFWRPWGQVVLGIWALVGVYDLAVSQFIPPETAKDFPKIVELAGRFLGILTIWTWLLGVVAILFLLLLEFAIRQNRKVAKLTANTATASTTVVAIPYAEWKNLNEIDLETAAAIWSGTRDPNDVVRHLRFRELKQAVRDGLLRANKIIGGAVNRLTTVLPSDLAAFLFRSGATVPPRNEQSQHPAPAHLNFRKCDLVVASHK